MTLRPEAAQTLGLALHELALNAAQYGALSTPSGRISITWTWHSQDREPAVEILWAEIGGPPVNAPVQRGFGSLVVERNLVRGLEAAVDLSFAVEGVRCRIAIPLAQLLRTAQAGA